MEIYVVQEGDTIESIAKKYDVSANKIVQDNGLSFPYELLLGQAIVITSPKTTYVVQQGDSLKEIAEKFDVTIMQLLRNNPFLSDREFIFPGETLVISYNTVRSITTMGYTYPFIDQKTLIKTLPELTCLSIINFTSTERGEIIEYRDESEIIKLAKEYGTMPLMLSTTLSPLGTPNLEVAYSILTNEEYQNKNIDESIVIMKRKGYSGMNVVFNYLNKDNEENYLKFVERISKKFRPENLLLYITINYNEYYVEDVITYDKINYSEFSKYVDEMIFLRFRWGAYYGPPAPVANLNNLQKLIQYVVSEMPSNMVEVGIPLLGYDWQLPYIPGRSSASSLSINSVFNLAQEVEGEIQFDEESQTPYIEYVQYYMEDSYQHIIWFVDVRSIEAVTKLIIEQNLSGKGIWNIMQYNAAIWTVINSTFDIIKLI